VTRFAVPAFLVTRHSPLVTVFGNFIALQFVKRKNRFPAGGEMVTLFVPLTVVTAPP
jgi:hypothetical protein